MEPKVIIYIIIGILYFVYSIWKKAQENKEASLPKDQSKPAKPISAPTGNPLEDVMREIKRRQAEADAEARRKATASQPKPLTSPQRKQQKEVLVREVKKTPVAMGEGAYNYEPLYERELTEEEKIHSGNIRLKNEGTYQVQTIEEIQMESDANKNYVYEFDAKQAFIGSIIFEKKF